MFNQSKCSLFDPLKTSGSQSSLTGWKGTLVWNGLINGTVINRH